MPFQKKSDPPKQHASDRPRAAPLPRAPLPTQTFAAPAVKLTAPEEDALHLKRAAAAPTLAAASKSRGPHASVVDALHAHLGDRDWAERCVMLLADNARARCDMPGNVASAIMALSASLEEERGKRG